MKRFLIFIFSFFYFLISLNADTRFNATEWSINDRPFSSFNLEIQIYPTYLRLGEKIYNIDLYTVCGENYMILNCTDINNEKCKFVIKNILDSIEIVYFKKDLKIKFRVKQLY